MFIKIDHHPNGTYNKDLIFVKTLHINIEYIVNFSPWSYKDSYGCPFEGTQLTTNLGQTFYTTRPIEEFSNATLVFI